MEAEDLSERSWLRVALALASGRALYFAIFHSPHEEYGEYR